jgi:hypothetical protein
VCWNFWKSDWLGVKMLNSDWLGVVVLLDNVLQDIRELEKGMEMTKREVEARKPKDVPLILQDFINNSEDKLKKLKTESTKAQVCLQVYSHCWGFESNFSL